MNIKAVAAVLLAALSYPAGAGAQDWKWQSGAGSDTEYGEVISPFVTPRIGFWGAADFNFHGNDAMLVGGVDAGFEIANTVAVFAAYDRAVADGDWIGSASANAGWMFPLDTPSPWERSYFKGMVFGGVTYNEFFVGAVDRLDLEFKKTVGRHAGGKVMWELPNSFVAFEVYGEGGLLVGDLDVNGSKKTRTKYGGGGFGISLRF